MNEFAVAVGRVRGLLLTEETAGHAVTLLAEAAKGTVPAASGAGVTLIRNGQPTSTGYTGDIVRRADALQYDLQQGPCLTAWASGAIIRVDDTRTEPRWPRWSQLAAELPLLSCVSVPLVHGREHIGALKVYSERPGAFSSATEELLVRLSSAITALLMHIQTSYTPRRMGDELHQALRGRDMISMAKGILMERHGLDEEQAHRRLLQLSARSGQPLQHAAESVISAPRRQA
ncbi:GAF and ANTAR domain-containing protein [Arthrobacter sp. USHLN218]|uniref:GAF and ANTAR domain-containing protein n=1 Tax=Arthrobacter sp. USHLN218 TaxID=3081232 RepID=UPI00301778F1